VSGDEDEDLEAGEVGLLPYGMAALQLNEKGSVGDRLVCWPLQGLRSGLGRHIEERFVHAAPAPLRVDRLHFSDLAWSAERGRGAAQVERKPIYRDDRDNAHLGKRLARMKSSVQT